jgi:hypothetical protein
MRKFKNKKLATAGVIFLLVFIMAGAFAMFQTILDVRGRVNMYAPTVDAIISNLTPVAAPLGLLADVADPDNYHDSNAEVRGPWLATAPSDGGQTVRFSGRQFFEVPWTGNIAGVGTIRDEIDRYQSLAGVINLPGTHPWVSGVAATALAQRDSARRVAWWAWGHDVVNSQDTHVEGAYVRPAEDRVATAAITEPSLFETLYLNLSFDNFAQFYYFNLELANVGVVPLELVDIEIERVDDPENASPAWEIGAQQMLEDDAAIALMHPAWAGLFTAGSPVGALNFAMEGQTFNVSPYTACAYVCLHTGCGTTTGTCLNVCANVGGCMHTHIGGCGADTANGDPCLNECADCTEVCDHDPMECGCGALSEFYTVDSMEGLLGLVNISVDVDPTNALATSGFDAGTGRVVIPVRDSAPAGGGNTIDVGLRFCVALENWEVLIANWEFWGIDLLDAFGTAAPGTYGDWDAYAAGTGAADNQEVLDAILTTIFDLALSGTFRISYTVAPSVDTSVNRPPTGVQPPAFGTP